MVLGGNPQRGLNWRRLALIALVGFVALFAYAAAPMAQCSWSGLSAAEIGTLAGTGIDDLGTNSSDVARANQTSGFMSGFFGSIPACYAAYPIHASSHWTAPGALGCLLAFFLFRYFDREQYKRRIRHASAGYQTASESGSKRRGR